MFIGADPFFNRPPEVPPTGNTTTDNLGGDPAAVILDDRGANQPVDPTA